VLELDELAAPTYIAERFQIDPTAVKAVSLGGGISNHVVLVETPNQRFVLKQSLPKLRVKEDWFSDQERIFRESASLRRLAPLLTPGWLPEVLFEDRDQFAYAMTAAPSNAATWKDHLMNGVANCGIAGQIARIQAAIMLVTWHSREWDGEFGDLTAFHQLRLNPYYEVTSSRHTDLAPHFAKVIHRCRNQRVCLVHGDWSPKNMMVDANSVMAIDFEVIHYGDPAFDSGFLLNHLLLKAFHRPEQISDYQAVAEAYWHTLLHAIPQASGVLESGTFEHLPLLLLARVDGKSPAEYISDPATKDRIRTFARGLLERPASNPTEVFTRLSYL
jgi:5-methylthioribose kinase